MSATRANAPRDEDTSEGTDAATGRTVTTSRREAGGATVAPEEELPYIDDRVSKVWVVLIVGVFVAILLFGILLGRGGVLTAPMQSPSPSPPSPSPTATLSTSPSPSAAASPSPTVSSSPAASPAASPSPAPTSTAEPTATPGST